MVQDIIEILFQTITSKHAHAYNVRRSLEF